MPWTNQSRWITTPKLHFIKNKRPNAENISGGLHLFKLLADESRDLFQAEKKIIFAKAEQIEKKC